MMLFALCLTSFQAHAQRYLPGMKGLQVTVGMADGVHWNDNTDFAYHIGAAYSVYTKNANRWVIGGEYLHKKYDYKDMCIPVEQFTAEGGYYLKFLSDRRKTFFLSLGLSALAGYETSNRSEKLLPDGSTLLDKDCFVYGGAGTGSLPDRPGGSATERKGTGVVRLGHREVPHAGIFGTEIHYQLTAI